MDQETIKAIIELVSNSNIGEVKIKQDKFKMTVRHKDYRPKGAPVASQEVVAPVAAPTPSAPTPQETIVEVKEKEAVKELDHEQEPKDSSDFAVIKSPMIGTFYRSSSPEQEPFIKVGDRVEKGDVIGIIEAMKLFNDIESEVSGKVVKVLVDNATAVEYDQGLFLIDPS